ncbi:response regulator [Neobacillus niacini]|uniref:response regulator n=1 Tax=Neobacillus niacini TaxID=86668 RepID=UPI00052F7CF1|nr:response regulator [Neobacillus niacini]KGM45054.1 AraC family transcriptional regulator [Neobacillus niacini]MEC1522685.1 response regulator [Neobacillus niacini]
MHKVIVVEDDRIIRRGICQAIPWGEHGFVVAGEAGDGEVALTLIEKEQPQVVVSDINMPFMSGLEMAKRIKEKSPETRIIFLTGYEDFKYAQEAVKLKAFDYLLKPVDSAYLLKKAKEAAADWEKESVKEKRIIESMPLLQQKFFQKLIREGDYRVDIENELLGLDVQIEGPFYAVILVKNTIELDLEGHCFKEKITSFTSSYFNELNCLVMNADVGEYAILLSLENDHDLRKGELAQALFNYLKKELDQSITITHGRAYPNLFEVGKSFLEARVAMDMRHIMGTGRVISLDETVSKCDKKENLIHDLEMKLENHIKAGLPEKAKETLIDLSTAIVDRKSVALSDLKVLAFKFSTMLFFEIEKWKKEDTTNSFNSSDVYKDIMELSALTEMTDILNSLIQQWSTAMFKKKEKNYYSHVDQAIKYMQGNFHDSSLTLQKVAELIHVSTPYLSNLFKMEKGFNFGDYLLELRMKKAMELLGEGNIKTYEVCEQVGYSNPQYFGICFKKYTGVTPAEFKKKFI